MASDKAARNAYNRAQGEKCQAQAREYDAKRAANDEKIRRLKEAKTKLVDALQDYNTFMDNVVDEVVLDINSDINHHQKNLSTLSGKIASLEAENGNLIEWAKNAWDMAANFFQSLV